MAYANAADAAVRNHRAALQKLVAFDSRDFPTWDLDKAGNYHILASGKVGAMSEAARLNYLLQAERARTIADSIAREISRGGAKPPPR